MLNGLEMITKTYLLSKKYGMDIFDLNLRISSGQAIKDIPEFASRLSAETIRSAIKSPADVAKVIVCGSPSMNYEVHQALVRILPDDRIQIM